MTAGGGSLGRTSATTDAGRVSFDAPTKQMIDDVIGVLGEESRSEPTALAAVD